MDTELEDFNSRIDLREYAASLGYELDRRESSRNSSIMRHAGDKVVLKRNPSGHYVYCSVRDNADNGSVIDFAQKLEPWPGPQGAAAVDRPEPFLPALILEAGSIAQRSTGSRSHL